jgi:hypothetical protein
MLIAVPCLIQVPGQLPALVPDELVLDRGHVAPAQHELVIHERVLLVQLPRRDAARAERDDVCLFGRQDAEDDAVVHLMGGAHVVRLNLGAWDENAKVFLRRLVLVG